MRVQLADSHVALGSIQCGYGTLWKIAVDVIGVLAMSRRSDRVANARPVPRDAQLANASLNGDDDAFRELVETHQDAIASQMRRFSGKSVEIEELVHEVFVEAYLSLRTYKARSPFLHWLRKIAVRVGYRYWKEQAKARTEPVPLSSIGTEVKQTLAVSVEDASEAREYLEEILKLLSPRDRLVLTLLYWDECTVAEAAELAGWTRTMIKVQAYRARKRLRKLVEEMEQ